MIKPKGIKGFLLTAAVSFPAGLAGAAVVMFAHPVKSEPLPAPAPDRLDVAPALWIDPDYGCEYLIKGAKGISARFQPNGLPVCKGKPAVKK